MSANHILISTLVQWSIEERARREKARSAVPRYDAPDVPFPNQIKYECDCEIRLDPHRAAIEQMPAMQPIDVLPSPVAPRQECVIGVGTLLLWGVVGLSALRCFGLGFGVARVVWFGTYTPDASEGKVK